MLTSSNTAILLSKIRPDVQRRVFATESCIQQTFSEIAIFIASSLADNIFEPAMMPGGQLAPWLGTVFGVCW